MFIIIFSSLFIYILLITYSNLREKYKKVFIPIGVVDLIFTIILMFTKINVVKVGNVTNVTGSTPTLGYIVVALFLGASLIVSLVNIKKIDKRYLIIFLIIGILVVLIAFTIMFPGIIIYDVILALLCYIMFFTIENPDIKMIEEIKKANDLSEKYNNDKSKFIFNMTQQVRYPLNSIEQKIEQALEMDNIEEIKEQLEGIKGEEKRISNIINGTLDVSRIDSKKIKIVEAEYNLSNLLKEISIKSDKMAAEKNIEFRTNIDESIPMYLYGDKIRMKQLINSIISNSIKYTNTGFVELNVSTIKTYDICRLIISVKDSGIGLKTEEIDKLFNNNNNDSIEEIDESDLKLDVVKKLVNIIGGTITVQSEKNKGSEFTIVVDQKIVSDETIYGNILKNYKNIVDKKKILFVSEDETQREFYKKRLSTEFNIELSKNGQECLERVRKGEEFNLIIINEETTKLSPLDILNKLNDIDGFNIKAVILCKTLDNKDIYIKEGFIDVLKTDMSQKSIIENINSIISK